MVCTLCNFFTTDAFNVLEHLYGFRLVNSPKLGITILLYVSYRNYSQSWEKYGDYSYCYKHHTSFGDYLFIGVSAHPVPGPRLPFNFFGVLDEVI